VKFLVDNQLPMALSRWIASRGYDRLHVSELGLAEARDAEVWKLACNQERVVISKDEDFLYLARQGEKACFIWVRMGNCRTAVLLRQFEHLWPGIEATLDAGERIIELR